MARRLGSKSFPPNAAPRSRTSPGSGPGQITWDAILDAAIQPGVDGPGKDQLVGYLTRIAAEHPDIFVRLLKRVLDYEAAENATRVPNMKRLNRQ